MIPVHYRRWFSVAFACFAIAACTAGQASKDVKTALDDTKVGCVEAEALLAGTPANVYMPYVMASCGIAEGLESVAQIVIDDFFAKPEASTLVAKVHADAPGAVAEHAAHVTAFQIAKARK